MTPRELVSPAGTRKLAPLGDVTREVLSPAERLEALCDEGSLTLLRSDVVSKRMGA